MNANDEKSRASGSTRDEGAPLGNTTKFVHSTEKAVEKYYLLALAKQLLPDMRIHICMAHIMPGKSGVDINYNHELRYAWYSNLLRCGCAWICAFCATRKSEQDREDLSYAVSLNLDKYVPVMVTLTMGHKRDDRLDYLINGLLSAYREMQHGRAWKLLVEEYGLIGTVRSLECTYSENGWHPHFHVLWLLDRETILGVKPENTTDIAWITEIASSLRNQLSTHYWRPTLTKLGYYCTDERGVNVQVGHVDIIEYIEKHGYNPETRDSEKWDIESEITRRTSKQAENGSRTMWDLLRDFGDGDKRAGALFKEYAIATKGKNPLRWSPGLRDKLQVIDTPEETVLYAEPEVDTLLAYLTLDHWRVVRKNRAQGKLIKIASEGDARAVFEFLNSLPGMTEVGEFWMAKGGNIDKYRYYD
jgi:hypothetical protein